MDNGLNITYLIFDGYVEMNKYRYFYFVILFTAYILILFSNSTIVCLIVIHRNLHEPMYIFIAALLINSLLFSTNIYPKILSDVLSEKQIISYSACLVQCFINYSLGGSEFLLLAVMAYDRYVSICKPLQYATIMRQTNITLFLTAAWLLPACQTAVSVGLSADAKLCNYLIKGIICSSTVYKLHCISSKALLIYGSVILVNVLVFPVLFILFSYTKIIMISYRSCREVKKKAAQTCLPHLLVLINYSCLSAYNVLLARIESDFSKSVNFILALQVILYHPLFNPIIYGLKMKEIYKHLWRLFSRQNAVGY